MPDIKEEKKLWKAGFKVVAGIDEAGRGPLAGPVVAGCVSFNFEIFSLKSILNDPILKKIKDSKKLSAKQREEIYEKLAVHPAVKWGVGVVSEKVIDKINILQATKLAMKKAADKLRPDYLLIDGNGKIYCATQQKCIIKGDSKVLSISAASIIAKVTRDRIMQKYHKKYPQYAFDRHKGYGTALHMQKIKELGVCPIHRKTFSVNKKTALS